MIIKNYKSNQSKLIIQRISILENIDMSQGLSQKQMMKLARKFGRKMKF